MGFMDSLYRIGSALGLATIEETPVDFQQQNAAGYMPMEPDPPMEAAYQQPAQAPSDGRGYAPASPAGAYPQQAQAPGYQQGYQPPRNPPEPQAYAQQMSGGAPQGRYDGQGEGTAAPAPKRAAAAQPEAPAAQRKPGENQLLIVYVRRVEDAQQYIKALLSGYCVLLNMEQADQNVGPRVLDQLTGASFALGGALLQVSLHVFVLAPSGMKVTDSERARMRAGDFVPPQRERRY